MWSNVNWSDIVEIRCFMPFKIRRNTFYIFKSNAWAKTSVFLPVEKKRVSKFSVISVQQVCNTGVAVSHLLWSSTRLMAKVLLQDFKSKVFVQTFSGTEETSPTLYIQCLWNVEPSSERIILDCLPHQIRFHHSFSTVG